MALVSRSRCSSAVRSSAGAAAAAGFAAGAAAAGRVLRVVGGEGFGRGSWGAGRAAPGGAEDCAAPPGAVPWPVLDALPAGCDGPAGAVTAPGAGAAAPAPGAGAAVGCSAGEGRSV